MIGPMHDFGHVVFIVRTRTAFDTRRIETIQAQDLYRTFDTQVVQFISNIQIDDIFLNTEKKVN